MSETDNIGNPVSTSWDSVAGQDVIVIRDSEGETIANIQKILWDSFEPETRDTILTKARALYG